MQARAPARRVFGKLTRSIHTTPARAAAERFAKVSSTSGASLDEPDYGTKLFPNVNARYKPDEHDLPKLNGKHTQAIGASQAHWEEDWTTGDLKNATADHVMLSWGHSSPAKDLPLLTHGEGVHLFDSEGNQYLDWTSQAVCCNFGHTAPLEVLEAVTKQMSQLPYVYGGMGVVPVRARLSQLMAEITPGDINGFLFPCGGAEANEAAIRIARRYTGKQKILTQYRSYHGGTAQTLGATGDSRRFYTESSVSGFVKIFNPQPMSFSLAGKGGKDEDASLLSLRILEEQIVLEGPGSIAAIMLESIVGAGGVLIPPCGYMEGVRALCDKYGILLILDEVMAGFGRTGQLFAFQHFDGVLPDIVTSAKGLTGAYLPLSMVGVREHIKQYFQDEPLGWGATYHAHPVAMACAYECVKLTLKEQLPQRAQQLEAVMLEELQWLVNKHPSVKQGRAIGLFGCLDLQGADGQAIVQPNQPHIPEIAQFRRAMLDNGLMGLFRPPLLHCCPPLVINEQQLRDGFGRLSSALAVLDEVATRVPTKETTQPSTMKTTKKDFVASPNAGDFQLPKIGMSEDHLSNVLKTFDGPDMQSTRNSDMGMQQGLPMKDYVQHMK
jgi:adenosylmethionine-8-amino-7-oxononanoate aminotransferase